MNSEKIAKYAQLIVKKGINIQKSQEVVIRARLDCPEFIELLCEECYKNGASAVRVEWSHQPLEKHHIKYQNAETLGAVKPWEIEKIKDRCENLPAMIYVLSEDPDALKGADQQKYSKALQARYSIFKPFRDEMENKYQWCICAVPGKKWAKKIFPDLSEEEAAERLWEVILSTSRADTDPLAQWEEHNRFLKEKCDYLNSLNIKSLHYTSANGTDLTVGLIKDSQFCAGMEKTLCGVAYNPNIPSEEIFISPDKNTAEGVVYSAMPFSYNGEIIDNFWLEFKNGKVVAASAEKNEALLRELISMDDGASRLGECALVAYDSPIRNTGILFFNTLFDENAACHLALGEGFSQSITGHEDMTLDECRKRGINNSIIHEDFMIGSEDMNITAQTFDGKEVPVFINGNWA